MKEKEIFHKAKQEFARPHVGLPRENSFITEPREEVHMPRIYDHIAPPKKEEVSLSKDFLQSILSIMKNEKAEETRACTMERDGELNRSLVWSPKMLMIGSTQGHITGFGENWGMFFRMC